MIRSCSRALLLLLLPALGGCMTYTGFQQKFAEPAAHHAAQYGETLYYNINGDSMFAGPRAIRDVVTTENSFAATQPREAVPAGGTFLEVKIEQLAPSLPAVVFGYISYSTLTIIPFWSNQDGSILHFKLYKNGVVAASEDFILNRESFIWAAMLPFIWVNLLTPDEEEAFAAATREFLSKNGL